VDRRSYPQWIALDNAAKIYPAARSNSWTAVFRLSVNLKEKINPEILQIALDNTLERIPFFGYRIRRGFFWYYMDSQKRKPQIQEDVQNPCSRMLRRSEGHFLMRLRYYEKRIALEVFHSLTDGMGALTFLMTLVAEYIRLTTGERIESGGKVLDIDEEPQKEEWEDSFSVYAGAGRRARAEEKAYHLKGTPLFPGHLGLISGIVEAGSLKKLANSYGAGINIFLCAVLLDAIRSVQSKEKSSRRRAVPVKISIPQNLRRYYPSRSLRNFSSYFNVSLNSNYGEYSFDDIIKLVQHTAGIEGMEPMVNARMSTNVAAENNRFLRLVPLFIKAPVLKLMYILHGERYFTTAISNLGAVNIPDALRLYIERMDLILGAPRSNTFSCGIISCNDLTVISFSRTVHECDVEKAFFRKLVKLGLHVKIESNRRE